MKANPFFFGLMLVSSLAMAQESPQHIAVSRIVAAGMVSEQKAVETIVASNAVTQGATALYTAGQSVTLQPGFIAQAGSIVLATVAPVHSVRTAGDIPDLSVRAYPNPFVAQTTVEYNLPTAGRVRHTLLNGRGQVVSQVEKVIQESAGRHQTQVEGADLPVGIYLYRIEQGSESQTIRLLKRE